MSIKHGFESPIWLAKTIVAQANPLYLKKAVIDVIDHLDQAETGRTSPYEVIDRIVQVVATGKYTPPVDEETLFSGSVDLADEDQVKGFVEEMNRLLGEDAPEDKSFEDFLKERENPDEDVLD